MLLSFKTDFFRTIKNFVPLSILLLGTAFLKAQTSPAQNITLRSYVNPGKACANICGYASGGKEYALLGTNSGMSIYDVTAPDAPRLVIEIPAVASQWREIKVYDKYAYVTTEGSGQGLQIVKLDSLAQGVARFKNYTGGDSTLSVITKIHSLHIDVPKGFCYIYGGSSTISGTQHAGAVVLDIKTDPWNPKFVGAYTPVYVHDGYVTGDTLFGGHINNGYFSIIDFKDKKNPKVLAQTTTPTAFTHNTWISDNHKTIFTTDENAGSYLAAYDITDVANIKLVDKIRTISGTNAIVHNTHILNDFAVTSWYTEGVTIVDVHRPQNMVQVGQYDTYAGTAGADFLGAWGVYPYLPSGNLVVSNIEGGLYVLTPQYVRACYLEGTAKDSITKAALSGVRVKISSTDPDKQAESNVSGNYYTGQATPGSVSVTYSKIGYISKTLTVSLVRGQVVLQNVELRPANRVNLNGNVVINGTTTGIPNALVSIVSSDTSFTAATNATGQFSVSNVYENNYTIISGAWGYLHRQIFNQNITAGYSATIPLSRGFQDDFWGDFGWEITGSIPAGASQGRWERGVPIATSFNGTACSPGVAASNNIGNLCYITGNGGGDGGANDVDGGPTILSSPSMNLTTYARPRLSFKYWFVNTGGAGTAPNDSLKLFLNNGVKDSLIAFFSTSKSEWVSYSINLKNTLPITNNMRVRFSIEDVNLGHILESAIDGFLIDEATSTIEITDDWNLKAYPNPFNTSLNVDFKADTHINNAQLKITNVLGQTLEVKKLSNTEGVISVGESLPAGIYLIQIEGDNKVSRAVRVVKN